MAPMISTANNIRWATCCSEADRGDQKPKGQARQEGVKDDPRQHLHVDSGILRQKKSSTGYGENGQDIRNENRSEQAHGSVQYSRCLKMEAPNRRVRIDIAFPRLHRNDRAR